MEVLMPWFMFLLTCHYDFGNCSFQFCVRLFIMHHKLIRFKTSFIINGIVGNLISVQHEIENCSSHFHVCLFMTHFYHFSTHDDQFSTKLRTSVPIFVFVFSSKHKPDSKDTSEKENQCNFSSS